jgi:hypothetical protein
MEGKFNGTSSVTDVLKFAEVIQNLKHTHTHTYAHAHKHTHTHAHAHIICSLQTPQHF